MNLKTLYATIASFIVYFLLSWLVYGILLMDFYEANTIQYPGLMNEMPDMFLMIVGGLIWCFFFVYIFQKWAGIKTIGAGFSAGLFITFLIMLSFDLYFLASMNLLNYTIVVVDVVTASILGGITGAVIGFVLGFGEKKSESPSD